MVKERTCLGYYKYVGITEKNQDICTCPENSTLNKQAVYETIRIKGQIVDGPIKGYRHECICDGGYETSKNGLGQADNTCKWTGNYN